MASSVAALRLLGGVASVLSALLARRGVRPPQHRPPPPGVRRATVLAEVDEPGSVERAEAWVERHRGALSVVRDGGGCGCCVVMWDVEGPRAVVDTLPAELSCDGGWVRGER